MRSDDLYVIGYYKHNEWERRDLLDVIHATWPDLLASAVPGDAAQPFAFNPSDVDIKILRKAAINPITQRPDGTPHATPGGGSALDGTSARAVAFATKTKRLCNQWERKIKPQVSAMLTSGTLVGPVTLHLEHRGADTFVVGQNDMPQFKLGPSLSVPPL